ncbi:AraC family transcriptional regulator [Heliobacterium chlorum]|uniref:AraC family transcriptional regulator n=1 Tax=Heliobacterium chlorum TaxID=2698 RepID=A0ABR7T4A7_HELCL|nr:CD1247 N-terminal domain-containing protein [Heliobacterium chlorum]MBC9784912.1 AraC family transcriptional regulator [Heliobacterium chlorum]
MQELRERLSYIQGLAEGLNVGANSREGRLLTEMLSLMGDMTDSIGQLKEDQDRLEEIIDSMDDDLLQLEQDVYEDDCDCDIDEDEDLVEIECPSCQERVYFDADLLDDEDYLEVSCPNCDQVVFIQEGDEADFEHESAAGDRCECESQGAQWQESPH